MTGIWLWLFISIALISINYIKAVEKLPCNYFESKDITDGIPQTDMLDNDSILFEGIVYPKEQYATIDYVLENGTMFTVKSYKRGCTCNIKPCLRLCCPLGHVGMIENKFTECRAHDAAKNFEAKVLHENNETRIVNLDTNFAYVHGYMCEGREAFEENEYQITHKGQIQSDVFEDTPITHHDYCFHSKLNNETNEVSLVAIVCYEEKISEKNPNHTIFASCMLISVVFIFATLFVYVFVPILRNLQGKCLICYLVSLAVSYTLLAVVQLNEDTISAFPCYLTGFSMFFSFLSAFFWLNVMNFDLWLNFRSKSQFKQFTEKKQFNLYSLYGWGIPAIFTTLVFILDNSEILLEDLRPGIGSMSCFVNNISLYFYLPIGIVLTINIGFFVMIALQIQQMQRDLTVKRSEESSIRSQKSLQNKREKYILFLRLFIVMGVVWSMEVISYIAIGTGVIDKQSNFFMLTDICNTLQGLLIFIIFVLNRRVFDLLKDRWQKCCGQIPPINDLTDSAGATFVPLDHSTKM